jgi:hypothetical protein
VAIAELDFLVYCSQKLLNYLAFQYLDIEPLPDEGFSRNALCTLSLLSTFVSQEVPLYD